MRRCCAGPPWTGTAGSTYRRDWPTSIAADDPRVSPIFAADHTDLPPALVLAASEDPLRDDATRYAAVLSAAGVPVTTRMYQAAIHGFLSIPLFEPAAHEALADIAAHLSRDPGAELLISWSE